MVEENTDKQLNPFDWGMSEERYSALYNAAISTGDEAYEYHNQFFNDDAYGAETAQSLRTKSQMEKINTKQEGDLAVKLGTDVVIGGMIGLSLKEFDDINRARQVYNSFNTMGNANKALAMGRGFSAVGKAAGVGAVIEGGLAYYMAGKEREGESTENEHKATNLGYAAFAGAELATYTVIGGSASVMGTLTASALALSWTGFVPLVCGAAMVGYGVYSWTTGNGVGDIAKKKVDDAIVTRAQNNGDKISKTDWERQQDKIITKYQEMAGVTKEQAREVLTEERLQYIDKKIPKSASAFAYYYAAAKGLDHKDSVVLTEMSKNFDSKNTDNYNLQLKSAGTLFKLGVPQQDINLIMSSKDNELITATVNIMEKYHSVLKDDAGNIDMSLFKKYYETEIPTSDAVDANCISGSNILKTFHDASKLANHEFDESENSEKLKYNYLGMETNFDDFSLGIVMETIKDGNPSEVMAGLEAQLPDLYKNKLIRHLEHNLEICGLFDSESIYSQKFINYLKENDFSLETLKTISPLVLQDKKIINNNTIDALFENNDLGNDFEDSLLQIDDMLGLMEDLENGATPEDAGMDQILSDLKYRQQYFKLLLDTKSSEYAEILGELHTKSKQEIAAKVMLMNTDYLTDMSGKIDHEFFDKLIDSKNPEQLYVQYINDRLSNDVPDLLLQANDKASVQWLFQSRYSQSLGMSQKEVAKMNEDFVVRILTSTPEQIKAIVDDTKEKQLANLPVQDIYHDGEQSVPLYLYPPNNKSDETTKTSLQEMNEQDRNYLQQLCNMSLSRQNIDLEGKILDGLDKLEQSNSVYPTYNTKNLDAVSQSCNNSSVELR